MHTLTEQQRNQMDPSLIPLYKKLLDRASDEFMRHPSDFRLPPGQDRVAPEAPETIRARELAGQASPAEMHYQNAIQNLGKKRNVEQELQPYLNPFVKRGEKAVDRQANSSTKKAERQLDAKFASLGQYGSSDHMRARAEALRDIQADANERKDKIMAQGYEQAMRARASDVASQIEAQRYSGQLASQMQQAHIQQMEALQKTGAERFGYQQMLRNLQVQDQLRQLGIPQNQIAQLLSVLSGVPQPDLVSTTSYAPPQPVMNSWGSIGQIATSLLGAGMRKRGGHISPAMRMYASKGME